jgi:integrase/recombinase XerC
MTAVTRGESVPLATYLQPGGKVFALLQQFNASQQQRGVLGSSIARRAADIKKFDAWLDPGTLLDATAADIEAFLLARGWCDVTRYAFLSHLHAFYRWAVRMQLIPFDPTELVERPRIRRGLPRPITDDDLAYLLTQADGRMHAWLMLGAFAGLRCIEISRLQRNDVNTDDMYLRILGKGDKERLVPLHPLVLASLRRAGLPRTGLLWTRKGGQAFTGTTVSQSANRWIRAMGVDCTMHRLRHWFGTKSYAECQDIVAVAELMGHANTATTGVYVAFSNRVARAAVLGLTIPGASAS